VVSEKSPPSAAKRKRTKSTGQNEDALPPAKKAPAKKKGGRKKTNEKVQEDGDEQHPDHNAPKDTPPIATPIAKVSEEPRLMALETPDDTERSRSEQPKTPAPVSPEKKVLKSSVQKQRGSHSPIRGGKVPYRDCIWGIFLLFTWFHSCYLALVG
jgi:hypothetical protein